MDNKWYILGERGSQATTLATVHELEYHGEWMEDEYVTVSVKTPEPIDFRFGDHLTYRDQTYTINYDPSVIKKAKRGSYAEGFTYDNIKLYSYAAEMKHIGFRDVVLNGTEIYSTMGTFSFYCATIDDFADRLQANLNRSENQWYVLTPSRTRTAQRGGSSEWVNYYTGNEDSGEENVNIDIDNQNCWEVSKFAYEKFGLSLYIVGRTIIIGGTPVVADKVFRYGKGLGLYEIERTSDEAQEIVTKLYAYGSNKNMTTSYYADLTLSVFANVTDITTGAYDYTDLPYQASMFTNQRRVADNSWFVSITVNDSITVYNDIVVLPYTDETTGLYYVQIITEGTSLSLSVGDRVYFTSGIRKHSFPSGHQYNSGNMGQMAITKLMLPGFPTKSLHQWLSEISLGTRSCQYLSASDASTLLSEYVFSTDPMNPWIMSTNYTEIGVWEGTVHYDGSSQQEIYPTIENVGINNTIPGGGAPFISDDGIYSGDPPKFNITISNIFDVKTAVDNSTDGAVISMKSGWCTGRDFKISTVTQHGQMWTLSCERCYDDSLQRYFPYSYYGDASARPYQISIGDEYVLTGIEMPATYVEAASVRLLIAACGYLDKRDHMRYTYLPKIDEIAMQRQHDSSTIDPSVTSLHDTMRAGMKMQFEDTDLGIWKTTFIDNITIKENGNNGIPTYDVVLRDEKEKGSLEKMTDSINKLKGATNVVERRVKGTEYVEYAEWVEGDAYYYDTLNTATGVVETSMVWHRGCLWMCLRTLTADEPWFTSTDWRCVRSDGLALNFFDENENPMTLVQIRIGQVDFTVVPYLLIGNEDITEENVTGWKWRRESVDTAGDEQWNASNRTLVRTLTITDEDLPTGYQRGQELTFECTATLAFEIGDGTEIMNRVIF